MCWILRYYRKIFRIKLINIRQLLFDKQDLQYKAFHKKIVPDTQHEIIGVRVPELRNIVKNIKSKQDIYSFFNENHFYYEEFMLHGLFISKIGNTNEAFSYLNAFLPQIDNWAVCDITVSAIKNFAKNKELLYNYIKNWLKSQHAYTVRFAIVCLLSYYVEKKYLDKIFKIISAINSDEYYINMAIAWLLSVMLVKNYNETLPLIESKTLPQFIQNKTIDKARDSLRIDKDKKIYLKTLKI